MYILYHNDPIYKIFFSGNDKFSLYYTQGLDIFTTTDILFQMHVLAPTETVALWVVCCRDSKPALEKFGQVRFLVSQSWKSRGSLELKLWEFLTAWVRVQVSRRTKSLDEGKLIKSNSSVQKHDRNQIICRAARNYHWMSRWGAQKEKITSESLTGESVSTWLIKGGVKY